MTPVAEAVQTPDLFSGFELYPLPTLVKVLITGSRGWTDKGIIRSALIDWHATHVVHGACPVRNIAPYGQRPIWASADGLADQAAKELGIPVTPYPADWHRFGHRAGFIRNAEMLRLEKPDIVLAFWDGVSNGTSHMIDLARKGGYRVKVYRGLVN